PARVQPSEKPLPGPEVGDAGWLDPAAGRLEDAPLHAPELARVVSVRADDEGQVHAPGPKEHLGGRVEAGKGGVDLDRGARLHRFLEDRVDVEVDAGPAADPPAGEVRDRVDR